MAQENYNPRPVESTEYGGIWALIAIIAVLVIGYLLFTGSRDDLDGIGKQDGITIEEFMASEAAEVEPKLIPISSPEPAQAQSE